MRLVPRIIAIGGQLILSAVLGLSQTFTISTPSPLPDALVGAPYQQALAATGGASPYFWIGSLATPLPPGLNLAGNTGMISGTPTQAGAFSFFVQATDNNGKFATKTFALTVGSPPVITEGGVSNAASYAHNGMPNAGIAPGSMFVVFGNYFGAPGLHVASAFPVPLQVAGTSVRVTVNGVTVKAPMIYASPTQLAAILPSSTPAGDGKAIVTYNGFDSAPEPIHVATSRFGIFTRNSAGTGPAIVQNFTGAVAALNSHTEAAQPGQILALWGTGLGPVSGDETAGPLPGDLKTGVDVLVGNQHAQVLYQGRSGCCAGIDQINFVTPAGIEGCFVPVAVVSGNVVSNVATISISSTGKVCSDATGFSTADLQAEAQGKEFRVGSVELFRATLSGTLPGATTPLILKQDIGAAGFYRFTADTLAAAQGVLGVVLRGGSGLAPFGACNVYPINADSIGIVPDPTTPDTLQAGPAINITGPNGVKQLAPGDPGTYTAQLGGDDALSFAGQTGSGGPLYLDPGSYAVDNGAGTADVGPFHAAIAVPKQIVWSNQAQLATVDHTRNLTVTWTGGDAAKEFVVIAGLTADDVSNAGGVFVCTAKADAGAFTVPSWVLSTLPAAPSANGPNALLWVGNMSFPQQNRFSAAGLSAGYLYYLMFQFQFVDYR